MGDLGPPGRVALGEPVDHHPGVTAADLRQQALIAGDVDQAGVPAVHPDPAPGVGVGLPFRLAAAGLVDAQHPHRVRFGVEHRIGHRDDVVVDGVPAAVVVGGDSGHRAVLVEDLSGHRRLGPRSHPRPCRHPGTASVNTLRSQAALGHNHFRLRHRNSGRSGPTCTSRGRVTTHP